MKKCSKPQPFALVSRNFLQYPLPRSRAATPRWQTKDCRRLMCPLHREPRTGGVRVVLYLPFAKYEDTARAPDRYDFDILFRLTALAKMAAPGERHKRAMVAGKSAIESVGQARRDRTAFYQGALAGDPMTIANHVLKAGGTYDEVVDAMAGEPTTHAEAIAGKVAYRATSQKLKASGETYPLEFRSLRELLAALGRDVNTQSNYRALAERLEYLASLRVGYFDTWREGGKQKLARHEIGLIDSLELRPDGSVRILLDAAFVASAKGYARKFRFPLPMTSDAALNLHMWCQTWKLSKLRDDIARDFEGFAAMIGLSGDSSWQLTRALDRAVRQVNQHRVEHDQGPQLRVEQHGSNIVVVPEMTKSTARVADAEERYAD